MQKNSGIIYGLCYQSQLFKPYWTMFCWDLKHNIDQPEFAVSPISVERIVVIDFICFILDSSGSVS